MLRKGVLVHKQDSNDALTLCVPALVKSFHGSSLLSLPSQLTAEERWSHTPSPGARLTARGPDNQLPCITAALNDGSLSKICPLRWVTLKIPISDELKILKMILELEEKLNVTVDKIMKMIPNT